MKRGADANDSLPDEVNLLPAHVGIKRNIAPNPPAILITLIREVRSETINILLDQYKRFESSALVCAAKIGHELNLERAESESTFSQFLKQKCPRLCRTKAYNYMKLARENPALLNDDGVQTAGHLLSESQHFALFSADDETKLLVLEQAEQGNAPSVAEIERLKKEKKALEIQVETSNKLYSEASKALYDNTQDINAKVKQGIEAEKINLQADIDKLASQLSADYQSKIDAQTDKISELRNQLAVSNNPIRVKELSDEIFAKQSELRQLNKQFPLAERNAQLRESLSAMMIQIAMLKMNLAGQFNLDLEQSTLETLKTTQHDLLEITKDITELCLKDETVDLEFD